MSAWNKNGLPTTGVSYPRGLVAQGPISYSGNTEWHNGYGALTELPDGRYQGLPTAGFANRRLQSLADFYATYEIVSSPEFLEKVKAEANKLGYEFVAEHKFRPTPIDPLVRLQEIEAHANKLIEEMEAGGDVENKYYSPNAELISDWIKANRAPMFTATDKSRLTLISLWYAVEARNQQKIGNKDVRRLIAEALESADTSNAEFMDHLAKMVHENLRLARILTAKAWSFSAPATRNHEEVSKVFAEIQKRILTPMGCELTLTKPKTEGDDLKDAA
jgi:hypothetical protein